MKSTAVRKMGYGNLAFLMGLGAFLAVFLVYPVAFMLRRGFGLEGEFTFNYFGLLATNAILRASSSIPSPWPRSRCWDVRLWFSLWPSL